MRGNERGEGTGGKARELLRRLVHKGRCGEEKYLSVLGLRFPYATHEERDGGLVRHYIRPLGMELCYKSEELPREENTAFSFRYREMPPELAFAMEQSLSTETKRIHVQQKAYWQLGYYPDLTHPRSLNEKIIYLALYYKNPLIAQVSDKGRAKAWIAERVGEEHVVPLLGVYREPNEIDFDALPRQFVAKLNDGWGSNEVMLVRDRTKLDEDYARAVMASWLYPWKGYYYRNLCITDERMEQASIVIEEYLEAEDGPTLNDYKLYCCNGEPRFALVVTGRGTVEQKRAFVDMDWNVLPFRRSGYQSVEHMERPAYLEELVRLSRELSRDVPFVRVDFYCVNGRIYVGELTFTPGMFLPFEPQEWDFKLGEYLELPEIKTE